MSQTIETYIIDSFTSQQFKGNPAGVCLINDPLSDQTMLSIAKELGFSETAFVQKIEKSEKYSIRFFSPIREIKICGHATLASAKAMFDKFQEISKIEFVTKHDVELVVLKNGINLAMTFPIYELEPTEFIQKTLFALGMTKVLDVTINHDLKILHLEIESASDLRKLTPDFDALKKSSDSINGVAVTAKSTDPDFDFEVRYFWPWSGGNEDPVTGGIQTFLAPYWSNKLGKSKLNVLQCSERTGTMTVEVFDDNIVIESEAQIVLKGELGLG